VEVCRIRNQYLIVFSESCECPQPTRSLMFVKRRVEVLETAALPDGFAVTLYNMARELNSAIKSTSHSHEKGHATTTGLRVRAKAVR
jgi:hypothetical protein